MHTTLEGVTVNEFFRLLACSYHRGGESSCYLCSPNFTRTMTGDSYFLGPLKTITRKQRLLSGTLKKILIFLCLLPGTVLHKLWHFQRSFPISIISVQLHTYICRLTEGTGPFFLNWNSYVYGFIEEWDPLQMGSTYLEQFWILLTHLSAHRQLLTGDRDLTIG